MKKRILACLLTLCLMVGLASAFGLSASAAGTTYTMTALYNNGELTTAPQPGDKVTVSNAEELRYLSAYTNAGGVTAYVTFELTADIVLNSGSFTADGSYFGGEAAVPFTPIGADNYEGPAFRGIFDGNGHTISGLYINSAERSFAGLFGHIAGSARICNLSVVNSYVAGDYYVGGILGFAQMNAVSPAVNNCTFDGYVYANSKFAGGIAGGAFGITVTNCVNRGTVMAADITYGIGGILGTVSAGSAQIVNCLNRGTVGGNTQSVVGGIVGQLNAEGTVANCVNLGQISGDINVGAIVGLNAGSAVLAGNHYLAADLVGVGNVPTDVATATLAARELATPDVVKALNALLSASEANLSYYRAWSVQDGTLVLSADTALATVTAGTAVYASATLAEATAIAAANEGSVLKLLRNGTIEATEIGGTYTFDFNGKHLAASAPLTVSAGTLVMTDSSSAMGGLTATGCSAVMMTNGTPTLKVNGGYIISANDAKNKDAQGTFAIVNATKGELILSGAPYIKGAQGSAIYVGTEGTLSGADGDAAYTGTTLGVSCGWIFNDDQILAKNAKDGQFSFLNYDTSSYNVKMDGTNYTVESIAVFPWILFAIVAVIAAGVVIFTVIHTIRFTRRMKFLSVSLPVMFPVLALITGAQAIALAVVGGICVVSVVVCILLTLSQNKKYNAAKAAKEAEQAAQAAEAIPNEETVEQTTEEVNEAAKEVAEETAEEVTEEAAEETAEEATEEVAEEAAEEVAEEAAEEVTEEAAEEVAEEATEEVAEEATEEVAEEVAEETAEEAAEEVAEEVAEEAAEEETLEEAAEDAEETEDEEGDAPAPAATPAAPPKVRPDRLVIAETDANGNVIYSAYKKSFTARVIQSPEDVQERYETLKNALLSYKKVNSRVSWSYDSIKSGRKQLAKFAIRGKSLCLFLALDPSTLEDSKYNIADAGKSKKYETVPCRLRLSSKRSIKWGLELISILAEREGLEPNPKFKPKEWRMENETTESLIEKGLIKKVL